MPRPERLITQEALAYEGNLRAVVDAAARGERTVVYRDGQPVAVVEPYREEAFATHLPRAKESGGLFAALGLLAEWETIEEDLAEVVADRRRCLEPPVSDGE